VGSICLWVSIAFALLFLGGIVCWVLLRMRALKAPFDTQMGHVAKLAVLSGKGEYKVSLDFSEGSIAQVDTILEQLHRRFTQGDLEEREMEKLALRWGAYVGEVAKRVKPGRWERDSELGPESLPLVFGENRMCFPVAWCYKRIENGEEDSIGFKFDVLIRRADEIDSKFDEWNDSTNEG